MSYEATPGRHGPIRLGERIGLGIGALVVLIALALSSSRAQDADAASNGESAVVVAQPAPAAQTVIVQREDRSGWDAVIDAVQNLILVFIAALVGLVGLAAWLVRGWIIRKFAKVDEKNMEVQTMKAASLNAQSDGLATISRELAKQAVSTKGAAELEAAAKALEGSKVIVLKPDSLPSGGSP